ncbi:hypothetical protein SDJN03_15860, partial [Cucurbita argyrosperma subsp. sororia]
MRTFTTTFPDVGDAANGWGFNLGIGTRENLRPLRFNNIGTEDMASTDKILGPLRDEDANEEKSKEDYAQNL